MPKLPLPPPLTHCPANIVVSGSSATQVDIDDLLAVISAWGACPAPPFVCPANIVASEAVQPILKLNGVACAVTFNPTTSPGNHTIHEGSMVQP